MASPFSEKRIAELLSPFLGETHLSDAQLCQVSTYLDLLLRWNSKINLTAVRDPEEIIARHFGESLFAARHLYKISRVPNFSPLVEELTPANKHTSVARTAVDIGSGAGFPGLPIKIFAAEIELTLVESNQKKAAFLREVIRSLQLAGVAVWPSRAEQLNSTADLVTLRAVEQFETILPVAERLVARRGRLATLIGISQFETAKSALGSSRSQIRTASSQIGTTAWTEPIPIPLSRNRVLAIANFG
jgi:16S rRNA (guanine527-N7)-methyltransferase